MSDNWREAVNQTINTVKIDDINQYVAPSSSLIDSPIDAFYATTQDILNVAKPDFLHQHPSMGTLLLVGLISARLLNKGFSRLEPSFAFKYLFPLPFVFATQS